MRREWDTERRRETARQRVNSVAPPSGLPAISPSRGEITLLRPLPRQSSTLQNSGEACGQPISPLEGEMAGRPEGGNVERWLPAGIGFAVLTRSSLIPTHALAHASDRGHVLLLPTGHYLVGGALAVAASFLVLLFVVRHEALERLVRCKAQAWRGQRKMRCGCRSASISFAVFAVARCGRIFRQPGPAVQSPAADGLDAALGRADAGAGPVREPLALDQSLVRAVADRVGVAQADHCPTRRPCGCLHGSACGRLSRCSSLSPGSS